MLPFTYRSMPFLFLILSLGIPMTSCFSAAIDAAHQLAPLCSVEMNIARQSNYSYSPLMHASVCFHANNYATQALHLYGYIRDTMPDCSYVLVNLGLIALNGGDPVTAAKLLTTYIEEVGGVYGDMPPTDRFAKELGPPCTAISKHKVDCVNALNTLGAAYISGSDAPSAVQYLKRAIQIGDEDMLKDVHSNLGNHMAAVGDVNGAADSFLKSFWIELRSGGAIDPSALVRRAILVSPLAESVEDAKKELRDFEARVRDIVRLVEFGGDQWLEDSSGLFRVSQGLSNLDDIRKIPQLKGTLNDWTDGIQTPHFFLHYYGAHDRPLQELVVDMYKRICPSTLTEVSSEIIHNYKFSTLTSAHAAPEIPLIGDNLQNPGVRDIGHQSTLANHSIESKRRRGKLNIYFVSSHFGGDEPHGLLLIDVIRRIPSRLFEVSVVVVGPKEVSNEFKKAINGRIVRTGYDEVLARHTLFESQADCIVFAEMQNEATLHFLGYQRFAPIQVLVMGAPVTSGHQHSIDYFISGDRLEHPLRNQMPGFKEPYSEQVVLFDGQAISFPRNKNHPENQDAAFAAGDAYTSGQRKGVDEYGIPLRGYGAYGAIYICFQSLHKIQPSFDFVLAQILHADEDGLIILQAARDAFKTRKISKRIHETLVNLLCIEPRVDESCPIAQDAFTRIHFIPRVKSNKMRDLYSRGSVVLHPFPFGGSKTAADSIEAAVPIVTYPQSYLRGRMAASFLTTMAMHEIDDDVAAQVCCIATSISDYVSKALRLGRDRSYRKKVSHAMSVRSYRIWDDSQTSFEWAQFLTRAMGVIIDPTELAQEMNYTAEVWQTDNFLSRDIIQKQVQWESASRLSALSDVYSLG